MVVEWSIKETRKSISSLMHVNPPSKRKVQSVVGLIVITSVMEINVIADNQMVESKNNRQLPSTINDKVTTNFL